MTVAVPASFRNVVAGSGSVITTDTSFQVNDVTKIAVVKVASDGTKTTLAAAGVGYTGTLNTDNTVNVVTAASVASGAYLVIYPTSDIAQSDTLTNSGSLFGSSIETALDKIARILETLQDQINMKIGVPRDDRITPDTLTKPETRKGTLLYFNATTGQVTTLSISDLADLLAAL